MNIVIAKDNSVNGIKFDQRKVKVDGDYCYLVGRKTQDPNSNYVIFDRRSGKGMDKYPLISPIPFKTAENAIDYLKKQVNARSRKPDRVNFNVSLRGRFYR